MAMPRPTQLRQAWPTPNGRGQARYRMFPGATAIADLVLARRWMITTSVAACAVAFFALTPRPAIATVEPETSRRAAEIEAYLPGHPKRALMEIPALLVPQDTAPSTRRALIAMQGHALVLAGRVTDAQAFSDRLETEARAGSDSLGLATALLVRSAVQSSIGDTAAANAFARQASALLQVADDPYLAHWALPEGED